MADKSGAEFQGLEFSDFSGGMDASSSEDSIKDGFVQELMNMEPTPDGYVRKRKGFRRSCGMIPLRCNRRTVSGANVTFHFEAAETPFDFTNVPRQPITIIGRYSAVNFNAEYRIAHVPIVSSTANSITVATTQFLAGLNIATTIYGIDVSVLPTFGDSAYVKWLARYTDEDTIETQVAGARGELFHRGTSYPSYYTGTTFNVFPDSICNFPAGTTEGTRFGPCFYRAGGFQRSRGGIRAEEALGDTGFIQAESAVWQAATGWTRYTIPVNPATTVVDSVVFSLYANFDYLQCEGASRSENNGEFLIRAFDYTNIPSGYITIDVENPKRYSPDFDETGSAIRVGSFTNYITGAWATMHLIPGDKLYSEELLDVSGDRVMQEDSDSYEIYAFRNNFGTPQIFFRGVFRGAIATGAPGATIFFRVERESPLVLLSQFADWRNAFVIRDEVEIDGEPYSSAYWFAPATLPTYTAVPRGDGYSEVTPSSGAAPVHRDGGYIYLKGATPSSPFQNIYKIEELDTTTGVFVVYNPAHVAGAEALTSMMYCLEFDLPIKHFSSSTAAVTRRWLPVDPLNSLGTPNMIGGTLQYITFTEERPFFHEAKRTIRPGSALLRSGNLYLTQPSSPLIKVSTRSDAVNDLVYLSSGLPRWQPHCAAAVEPGGGTLDDGVYNYYFRLQYTDSKGRTHISAASGANNSFSITTGGGNRQVHFKLTVPSWIYALDLANIYINVYRTEVNGTAYYLAYSLDMLKSRARLPYITFTDNLSDDLLILGGADTEMIAATGSIFPVTTLDSSPSAKYITSLANRTILANITAVPRFRLSLAYPTPLSSADMDETVLRIMDGSGGTIFGQSYEFVGAGYGFVSATAGATSNGRTFYTIATGGPGNFLPAGSWVYMTRGAALVAMVPNPWLSGWHRVIQDGTDTSFVIAIDTLANPVPAAPPPPAPLPYDTVDTVYVSQVSVGHIPIGMGPDVFSGEALGNTSSTVPLSTVLLNRLAKAINATNSMGDDISGLYAAHGADIEADRDSLVIWQGNRLWGLSLQVSFENRILAPTISSPWFVEERRLFTSTAVNRRRFPSRLAISYENQPELFDATHYDNPANSASCIDVNPADGQEITGVISVFGESVSGGSSKETSLLVFKERGIYLVDIVNNVVQKLDTRGLGCEAPESIQYTNQGIIFANRYGIFRLNRNYEVEDLSDLLDRRWGEVIDAEFISEYSGHLSPASKSYTFTTGASKKGFTYYYRREHRERGAIGSWSELDGIPALRWISGTDTFGGPDAQVYEMRDSGTRFDFQDDVSPISAWITTRPEHFGSVTIRKRLANFHVSFRNVVGRSEGVKVWFIADSEIDLEDTEETTLTDAVILDEGSRDALGQLRPRRIETYRFSIPDKRHVTFAQVKIKNEEWSQDLQVTRLAYTIAALEPGKGTAEASKSR